MAETLRETASSWQLTVETKINIDEMIYLLSPDDLPLLTGMGSDGNIVVPRSPVDNTEFSWLEEETPLPRATLNEPLDASETDITLLTGEGIKFAVGDAIRIDDEIMLVTSVSTDVLNVTRGSAAETNTTAATHAQGAEVIGIGTVLVEGGLGGSVFQGRDKYSNYTQIFSRKLNMTRTAQGMQKYGVPNELAKQLAANQLGLWTAAEQAAMYQVKHLKTATKVRQTGGLDYYITSNVDAASTHLTVETIEDMQQLAYNRGGSFQYVVAQPLNLQALNNTAGNERVQTVTIDDVRRGRRRAQVVMTEFGDVELVRSRYVAKADAFCVNRENFVMRVFQPLVVEKLAKTDDTDTYSMVGEWGYEVKGQAHMGKFSALDATQALPGSGLV